MNRLACRVISLLCENVRVISSEGARCTEGPLSQDYFGSPSVKVLCIKQQVRDMHTAYIRSKLASLW